MYLIKEQPEDFIVEENLELETDSNGDYVYFVLKKKNWTTLAALEAISKKLHVPMKRFTIAGIKDKNAITLQHVAGFKIAAEKLASLRIPGITITVLGRGTERMKLGQHAGNTFTITVRNLEQKYEPISFVENYFDDQRFSGRNHLLGRALTKNEWTKVLVMLRITEEGNPIALLRKHVSKKMLTFYLNAYQSYLWNEAVHTYIKNHVKKTWTVDYQCGELMFSKEKMSNAIVPLLGYLIQFRDPEFKIIYENLMEHEGITLDAFTFRSMPELRSEGNERNMIIELGTISCTYSKDERHKGKTKCVMNFTLPSGSYATMIIKKMFSQN